MTKMNMFFGKEISRENMIVSNNPIKSIMTGFLAEFTLTKVHE